jgi:hypothetical protein
MDDNMNNLPVYFNCFCVDHNHEEKVCTYKIVHHEDARHPFRLLRLKNMVSDQWEDMSVYASLSDAIRILVHELFTPDITEAIRHGQAFLNVESILEKIEAGDDTISISNLGNENAFNLNYDIIVEDLISSDNHHA